MNKCKGTPPPLQCVVLLLLVLLCNPLTVKADSFSEETGGVMPHEHQWAYAADDYYHWERCQFEGCTAIRNKEPHAYVDNGHASCTDPNSHSETCAACGYYHILPKTHEELVFQSQRNEHYHRYVCSACCYIYSSDYCYNEAGQYLSCYGVYKMGYPTAVLGKCAVCDCEYNFLGHAAIWGWPETWSQSLNYCSAGYAAECTACHYSDGCMNVVSIRNGSDPYSTLTTVTYDLGPTMKIPFNLEGVFAEAGTCNSAINAKVISRGVTQLSSSAHNSAFKAASYWDDISSEGIEDHTAFANPDAIVDWGILDADYAQHVYRLHPTEWEPPQFTSPINITDRVVSSNGWTTAAKCSFSAADNASNMLYYDVDGNGVLCCNTTRLSAHDESHNFNIEFRPDVEADEVGRYVSFQIWDGAGNYAYVPIFLQKWDHKPPTALTEETNFGQYWENSKHGIVSCTDMGSGNCQFAFNNYSAENFTPMIKSGTTYKLEMDLVLDKGQCIGPNGAARALYYVDETGNPRTQYLNFRYFDCAAPTVSFPRGNVQPWYRADGVTYIDVSAVDATCTNIEDYGAAGSGVAQIGWSLESSPDDITWLPYSGSITMPITESGNYLFWAKDNVGNISDRIPAVYIPVDWYIEYHNTNGGVGSIPRQQIMWNEWTNLSNGTELSNAHHNLVGWSTDSAVVSKISPVITYNLGQPVFNLVNPGGTLDLYAVWEPWYYYVNYHSNNPITTEAVLTMGNAIYEYGVNYTPLTEAAAKSLNSAFTRPGYYIESWSKSPKGYNAFACSNSVNTGKGASTFNNLAGDKQTAHLYAKWKGNPYTIEIHDNYGLTAKCTCAIEKIETCVGEDVLLPVTACKHGNAVLIGYSTTPEYIRTPQYTAGSTVKDLTLAVNGTVHLYRVWDNVPTITSPNLLKFDRAKAVAAGLSISDNNTVTQADLEVYLLDYAKATDPEWYYRCSNTSSYPEYAGYDPNRIPVGSHNGYNLQITGIDPKTILDDLEHTTHYIVTYMVTDDVGNQAISQTELFFGDEAGDDWITIMFDTN